MSKDKTFKEYIMEPMMFFIILMTNEQKNKWMQNYPRGDVVFQEIIARSTSADDLWSATLLCNTNQCKAT